MMIVYLLSVDELKERTTLDLNIEDKLLENSILDAQEIDLQNVIGTRLYEKLKYDVTGSTVTGVYKTLLDTYITNFLLKFAQRRSLTFLWVKFRNKGMVQQNSDNSQPIDIQTFDKIRNELQNDCEFFSNRLKNYLLDEYDNLPEYAQYNPDGKYTNMTPDKNDSFFSGIHLEPSSSSLKGTWMIDYLQSNNQI